MGVVDILNGMKTWRELEQMRDDFAAGKDISPEDESELMDNTSPPHFLLLKDARRASLRDSLPTEQDRVDLRTRAEKERQWKPRHVRGHR